jgi:hypothetical protein
VTPETIIEFSVVISLFNGLSNTTLNSCIEIGVGIGVCSTLFTIFLFLETENPKIDLSVFKLKCNSNVPEDRGGFPEMDAYEWADIETAKKYLHPTQVAALEEIQNLINEL